MKHVAFAVPGDLDTPTGGYAYDKRIIAELRGLGWDVDVVDLGDGFPKPDPGTRAAALARLLAIPANRPIVVDGLAFGVMAGEAGQISARNPLIALVHHPLALETGIDPAVADGVAAGERAALGFACGVVVTSAPTARILIADYAVPADRITVVRPGVDVVTDTRRVSAASISDVKLLAVGSIIPRKGYDVLMAALGGLTSLRWRLTIAGDLTREEQAVARLKADAARFGLQDRVRVLGAQTSAQLAELYADADVFVLASQFEGYGMVFSEAIAHGLPVVATDVGAAREVVPPAAGLLVAPADADALREALRRVIHDGVLRTQMADAARIAAAQLPRWRQSAEEFARMLAQFA